MKFKKEYRWLLFLIIPFIVFMFILFMAPLQIVLNSQPLATQTYGLQKSENIQNQLRSTSFQSSKSINYYLEFVNQFITLFSNNFSEEFSVTNVNSVLINNAFTYYQNNSAGNISNETMWYANGKSAVGQLTPAQNSILKAVLIKQPRLKSMFNQLGDSIRSLVGIYNFYDIKGSTTDDMAFYYPTYKQKNYSSLNYTVDQGLYQSLINNQNNTNSSYILINSNNRPSLSQNLISLCKLRNGSNTLPGFTCLDIDTAKFNSLAMTTIGTVTNLSNYYLVSPAISGEANATIIDNITTAVNSIINLEQAQSILTDVSLYRSLQSATRSLPYPYMLTIRTSIKSYYLFILVLWEEINQANSVVAYYLVENYQTINTVDLQSANVLSSSLNTLLIPTFILIIVSLIISVVVLRFLMNGLDLQLHKLNERCKFIVDGDLDIEIPEYQGTKDIYQVYEEVKIINKLHRYTSKDYFVGHFSNRIFKYNEALQVVKKLKYDPSNLMENIGQAYIYIEQYDKSIHYLKESVKSIEKEIEQQFGGLDRMVLLKQQKEKVPNAYKDMEIILIRRLWKLVFCLFKYVELQIINAKQLDQQNLSEEEKAAKKQRLQKQTLEYITKLKKALYPDFKSYAESCMLLNFQIKFLLSFKNFDAARECLARCLKITQAYAKEYDQITKKLKEKGSKNLYFFRKNKLSGHSRSSPQIMQAFYNYTRSILLTNDPKVKDYYTSYVILSEALRKNLASHSVNYLLFNEIKKLFGTLKISLDKLETTQVFRQSMPYKTLYYGPITKQIEPTLYRVARNPAEVECREYVVALDASYYYSSEKQLTDQLKYLRERSEYLYDKIIKKFDRVSLIQANSEIGIQTICNLILKEFNQSIIRKSLLDMTNYQFFNGRNQLLSTLEKIIFRIRNLQCEKVIILYLKYIQSYIDQRAYKGKARHKSKSKRKMTEAINKMQEPQRSNFIEEIGDEIQDLMSIQGLRNCKLLLMCASGDEYYRLINVFGLRDINKRIWSHTDGLNKNNNVVYIIDQKHKTDLDRILMSKLPNVSDNHVFAL